MFEYVDRLGIVTIKKSFHKEKGHFTSKEKGTFCVIFKVGGALALRPCQRYFQTLMHYLD